MREPGLRTLREAHADADWGCQDGVHNGWIVVEVGSKEEARNILPPPFRRQARIVALNHFTVDQMDEVLNSHRT